MKPKKRCAIWPGECGCENSGLLMEEVLRLRGFIQRLSGFVTDEEFKLAGIQNHNVSRVELFYDRRLGAFGYVDLSKVRLKIVRSSSRTKKRKAK